MATKSEKVLISETKKTVESMKVGPWAITFYYEGEAGKKYSFVSAQGENEQSTLSMSLNASTPPRLEVSIPNEAYDSELIEKVKKEMEDIINTVA